MTRSFWLPVLIGLFVCVAPQAFRAQAPLATYGTQFTFAIPEGADDIDDPVSGGGQSQLFLLIISSSKGSGTITSPSGYSQSFCYDSVSTTTVSLPHSLMIFGPSGKSENGLLLQTKNPVQVILFDYLYAAGEMTQLYPDVALGQSYLLGTWGVFNDSVFTTSLIVEDNKTEIVVTAPSDNTTVTITPSVIPIGAPNRNPIMTVLNRGESYIVKADSNSAPIATSLSGSVVTADKPVSVITGLTCGYVPFGNESCNELLNMPLPSDITDTIFYTAPFSDFDEYGLLFVSDMPDYFVIDASGLVYQSTNGIVTVPITNNPQKFTTTVPAECYELSIGSFLTRNGISDPSMVNVMPTSQWLDSLQFYLPPLVDQEQFNNYSNFISVIYPTAAQNLVLLDGTPIKNYGASNKITASQYTSSVIQIPPGQHIITSPQPVTAIASEFSFADAYSYNVGGMLPAPAPPPVDSITWFVTADTLNSPSACHDVAIALRLHTTPLDHPDNIHTVLTFDALTLTLLGTDNGVVLTSNSGAVTTTASNVTVDLSNSPIIPGDTIIIIHFHCANTSGLTSLTLSTTMNETDPSCLQALETNKIALDILNTPDIEQATFTLQVSPATAGSTTTGLLTLASNLVTPITSMTVRLQYNHNLLQWNGVSAGASIGAGLNASPVTNLDATTDEATVSFNPSITQAGEILKFNFIVFVTDTNSSAIGFSTDISNASLCPLDIIASPLAAIFVATDTCGTSQLRNAMGGIAPIITSVVPNPASASVRIEFSAPLPQSRYSIDIMNVLGNRERHIEGMTISGLSSLPPVDLIGFASGTYFFDIDIDGLKRTASIVIRN